MKYKVTIEYPHSTIFEINAKSDKHAKQLTTKEFKILLYQPYSKNEGWKTIKNGKFERTFIENSDKPYKDRKMWFVTLTKMEN